ncbi:protein kinase [Actinomadura madurae]|uniref:protein kinase domain-containing protein n=1 Tax=Actinomadura madurae TaxID=1993 RepID=UPI002026FFF8|nr:phosphotransferase [Actinomadura madurae]URN01209.1 protein kinase [Actinomadura madurae]
MTTTKAPATFGAYQVDKLLGSGMHGETYLAADLTGRRVAVKTIHADAVRDRKARSRLVTEVVALQSVHPAFVPTFIQDNTKTERPYFVMEYVEGITVDDVIAGAGQLSDVETERLAVRLTAILAATHAAGIAHGDFRGQNLIISRDGGIYLLDFGRAVLKAESRKEFRRRRRSDLRQLGELIVLARNGRAPFGEDSSLAIERFSEGRADVGVLTGRTRSVALQLLRRQPGWRVGLSAKRAHRILVRGRSSRRRVWSGMFVMLVLVAGQSAAAGMVQDVAACLP